MRVPVGFGYLNVRGNPRQPIADTNLECGRTQSLQQVVGQVFLPGSTASADCCAWSTAPRRVESVGARRAPTASWRVISRFPAVGHLEPDDRLADVAIAGGLHRFDHEVVQGDRCLEIVDGPLVQRAFERRVLRIGIGHDSLTRYVRPGRHWIRIAVVP